MSIIYKTEPPDQEQFFTLFESTGWNQEYQVTAEDLARMLANSQFVVAAYDGQELVGFGRILTDGVMHAMIYEMIVLPSHQGQGLGKRILQKLVEWCQANRIRDIQLFCAGGKRLFYEKNGFVARPDDAPGMDYRRQMQAR